MGMVNAMYFDTSGFDTLGRPPQLWVYGCNVMMTAIARDMMNNGPAIFEKHELEGTFSMMPLGENFNVSRL